MKCQMDSLNKYTYLASKLKHMINDFREYLIYRCTSRNIVNDPKLYEEYMMLLRKYEEFFEKDIID